ncbi:MAG: 3-dehydroquinate synthase [bacterium]|nr:3-dehydroquinate synthase [bacterium]
MRSFVKTLSKKYPVIIEQGIVKKFKFPKNAFVISDDSLRIKFKNELPNHQWISFSAGEHSKNLTTVEELCEKLVKLGANRSSSIIAFGGGIVGDIAGFVASIYMRGIPFYQVPTSLLAMVDASVGGKTGVDLNAGKNLIGSFYQPEAVLIDPTFLVKLPQLEFSHGMAEVIKHGVIDGKFFNWLENNQDKIKQRDVETLSTMIAKNVKIKSDIVEQDEKEGNVRMLLNLGHTFGHAIEKLSEYAIPHGEAVAMGMIYAAEFSESKDVLRITKLLYEFGLSSHLEKPYTAKSMVGVMMSDKKNKDNKINLVLPQSIGDVKINSAFSSEKLEKFISNYYER